MKNIPKIIDIEEIKKILPHRYPFLLIDRVIEVKQGDYIKALKNITYNEPFFHGHFPNKSVMPGVLNYRGICSGDCLTRRLWIQ